ncbi:protein-export chaperone SecB [Buchnera aphidicola]|uniref:protein-export chaperone SecB n=1 Tax=Buchnera aphidicola TaxID=9 RepID=UPI0030EBFDCF
MDLTNKINKKKIFFNLKKVYIKDISFEAPNTPKIYNEKWNPKTLYNVNIINNDVEDNLFEIILQISLKVIINSKLVFLCEVHQAGLFFCKNIPQHKMLFFLRVQFPHILFPYARECVSNLICRSGFPQLNLDPINFEKLYKNLKN